MTKYCNIDCELVYRLCSIVNWIKNIVVHNLTGKKTFSCFYTLMAKTFIRLCTCYVIRLSNSWVASSVETNADAFQYSLCVVYCHMFPAIVLVVYQRVCCVYRWAQRMCGRNSSRTTGRSGCTTCVCRRWTYACSALRRPTTRACWSGRLPSTVSASCRRSAAGFCRCTRSRSTRRATATRCVRAFISMATALDAARTCHCSSLSCR